MTYSAYITRIKNVRKHHNADRLLIGECFGNQVVVGIDTKEDELGVYFPTDGRLSMVFMEANNLIGKIDPDTGERSGGFFDEKGKVRTQKFRGEKSDGFWCPVSFITNMGLTVPREGTPFTEIDGVKICEKYITEKTARVISEKKKKKTSQVKFPMFHEHIDTEQLAYNLENIKPGQFIVITEKVHGTSGRSSYSQAVTHSRLGKFINNIFKREIIKPQVSWQYVCGTRRVVIKDFEKADGFYKDDEIIRKHAHEMFVGKLHKGETVYYEIVGDLPSGKPIMPEADNSKLGKEFVKRYGKTTRFHYGCALGEFRVFVYRISMTNEDGIEIDYTHNEVQKRCAQMGIECVPTIARLSVVTAEYVFNVAGEYSVGSSLISPTHIREGVVVRIDGSKWKAYKCKSFEFKVLENIIKEYDIIDLEESQDI